MSSSEEQELWKRLDDARDAFKDATENNIFQVQKEFHAAWDAYRKYLSDQTKLREASKCVSV